MDVHVLDCPAQLLAGLTLSASGTELVGIQIQRVLGERLWSGLVASTGGSAHTILYAVHTSDTYPFDTQDDEIFVGVEIDTLEGVPEELAVQYVSPVRCAKFPLVGLPEDRRWLEQVVEKWMKSAGYARAQGVSIVSYAMSAAESGQVSFTPIEFLIPVAPVESSPRLTSG